MIYKYKGDAIERLLQSYKKDKEPYITDISIKFPKQDNGFKELITLKELFFPNYWNCGFITKSENKEQLETKIDELGQTLFYGILPYLSDEKDIGAIVDKVLNILPDIREILKKDLEAAYKGDPAAKDYTEIIRSYPGFSAILVQRFAHILYKLKVTSYARELTERIHSMTGVDIHPGASVGEYFFIDHGTGVVIGETTEIGNHVRIYQGVTLGALHFEKDEGGTLKKGYKRHPTIGNNVVIGVGAKILGGVSIGDHVSIGANSWIEEDIPDYTTVFISEHPKLIKKQKEV
ncbi:serine acetyltransferase [Candidatus Woesearchaeota archaeon]|nr:serine acetyltransferase [Candidatus Woesearchaeota archaeon]